jgi:hypothetical protein
MAPLAATIKRTRDEDELGVSIGLRGAYLKQMLQDKLIEHKHYINRYGQDLPEVRNWKWRQREADKGRRTGVAKTGVGSKGVTRKLGLTRKAS